MSRSSMATAAGTCLMKTFSSCSCDCSNAVRTSEARFISWIAFFCHFAVRDINTNRPRTEKESWDVSLSGPPPEVPLGSHLSLFHRNCRLSALTGDIKVTGKGVPIVDVKSWLHSRPLNERKPDYINYGLASICTLLPKTIEGDLAQLLAD